MSQLYSRVAPDYLVLTLGQERIETTPEHPFYVESKGWTKAGELQVGDRLRTLDGNAVALTGVESREGPVRVYNLTVDETQTYHVSESKLLTHNVKCSSKREAALGRTPGKNSKAGREVQKRWSSKVGSTSAKLRKVSGKIEVKVRVTSGGRRVWKPLDRNIHMGHKLDAVEAWNQGIPKSLASDIQTYSGVAITPNKPLWKFGARSAGARAFMNYPGNYRFEWGRSTRATARHWERRITSPRDGRWEWGHGRRRGVTDEMDDAVFQSITKQCDEGSKLFHLERFAEALEHFKMALQLIPRPLENWEASTWVLSAIGDSLFLMGDAASAGPYLQQALECPGGLGNEFIHLRIGQVAFEQGEKEQAREHLARAYMGGGAEIFEGEDPKYLQFLRKHMQGI